MDNYEIKNFNFEVKATDDNEMAFEGYGSIFGNLDSYRDIVEKGCFSRTLKNNKNRIKLLWQHDSWNPIGKPMDIYEDDKGLFVKGKLSDITQGREAYTLIKDKVINEMSIGYKTIQFEYNKDKDIRYLKEVKLFEISLVTWAANEKAKVNNVKAFNNMINQIKNINTEISQDKILEAINYLKSLIINKDSENNSTLEDDNPIEEIVNNSDDFDLLLNQLKKYKKETLETI